MTNFINNLIENMILLFYYNSPIKISVFTTVLPQNKNKISRLLYWK